MAIQTDYARGLKDFSHVDQSTDTTEALRQQHTPRQPVRFPQDRHINNQIQQIKVAAQNQQPSVLPTLPKQVTNIQTSRVALNSTQHQVTVTFNRDVSDNNYKSVNIFLKQGNNAPSLVTSGPDSPLVFITPKSSRPSVVIVQAVGNWGTNPINNSPSKSIKLS